MTPEEAVRRDGALIRAYAEERLSVSQCAEKFRVSRRVVQRTLDRHGIAREPQRRRPRIRIDEEALVTAYRDQGLSIADCARKFGISYAAATRVLDRHQVSRHPPSVPMSLEREIVSAYRAGASVVECARRFDLNRHLIRPILARHGIVPPIKRPRFAGIDVDGVVAARVREGLTTEETATRFGIARQTVQRIVASRQAASERADLIPVREAVRIAGIPAVNLSRSAGSWRLTVHRTAGGHRLFVRGEIEDLAVRLTTPHSSPAQAPGQADEIGAGEAAAILGITATELARRAAAWQLTVRQTYRGSHRYYVRGEIEDLARNAQRARNLNPPKGTTDERRN